MEHIVQFGITIDDEAIKKVITRNATEQVANSFKRDIMNTLGEGEHCTKLEYRNKLLSIIENTTNEFLENNKDEIINLATQKLTDKLCRTKAVKEMVNKTLNSLLG